VAVLCGVCHFPNHPKLTARTKIGNEKKLQGQKYNKNKMYGLYLKVDLNVESKNIFNVK
jgi:hypothetical protein